VPTLFKFTRGNLPFWLTATVMAVFLIVFLIAPIASPSSGALMTAEFIKQYEFESSYDQRISFLVSVIAIALLSTAALVMTRRETLPLTGGNPVPRVNLLICIVVVAASLAVYYRLIDKWIVKDAALLAVCGLIFTIFAPHIRRRTVEFVALLLIGAYVSIVVIPGFLIRPIFWPVLDAVSIAQIELHITSLVQPGTNIASGQNFFSDIPFGYGLLMPSIVSVLERRFGLFTVGGHATFVQACQAAFLILGTLAYFTFRPRNYVGIFVALLLSAPYWSTAGIGIWHPNQSGFRSLTLPLGILAIGLAGRMPLNAAAIFLGAIEMVCLLINIETAIAVGGGILVYFILRTRSIPLTAIVRMSVSAIAVFVLYLILYRIALGRLPFETNLQTILTTFLVHVSGDVGLRLFTAGVWNEGYYIVPLALVMFTHAAFVVISSFQRLGDRALSHLPAMKAAIATILIAWFAYFINMPNWWQIWTHLFLYSFLIIDLFDMRLFAIGTADRTMATRAPPTRHYRVRLTHIAPMLLLLITIFHTNSNLAYFTREFLSPYWTRNTPQFDTVIVSEMQMPRAAGNALVEKSKFLGELAQKNPGQVVFLTYNSEFVPVLSRVFEPAPARNLWGYIQTDSGMDPAIDKIVAKKPVAILIDAPTGPLAVEGPRREFQDRVRKSVGRTYHLAETTSGWQIWRPNNL
jgi:hypothetical protein